MVYSNNSGVDITCSGGTGIQTLPKFSQVLTRGDYGLEEGYLHRLTGGGGILFSPHLYFIFQGCDSGVLRGVHIIKLIISDESS
jgi:hypothetical protein